MPLPAAFTRMALLPKRFDQMADIVLSPRRHPALDGILKRTDHERHDAERPMVFVQELKEDYF